MSLLRRLFGGAGDAGPAPEPTGAPAGPVVVTDPGRTLAEHVERLLARPELEFLIVEWDGARNLSLQLAPAEGGGLRAETVGDRYLEPRHRLREERRNELVRLGWREATGSGSWERTWEAGTAAQEVAGACVAAMAVYGVTPRVEWTITFGAD